MDRQSHRNKEIKEKDRQARAVNKQVISICLISELNEQLENTLLHYQAGLTAFSSLEEAWRAMPQERGCLIILDATALTTQRALESIYRMRLYTYAPILILAPAEAADQLMKAGADACLQADDPPEHIITKTLTLLRRYTLYNNYDDMPPDDAVLYRAQLVIDKKRHRVTLAGEDIPLQSREFRLLWHLARNPGIVYSSEQISEIVWPESCDQNRDVSALISELRRKLGDDWEAPTYIETLRYVGYRFLPKW